MRLVRRNGKKLRQFPRVFVDGINLADAVVMFEILIADAVAFKGHVIADRRQKPRQRIGRGLLACQTHALGMAHQIIIRELALDLQQAGGGAVAAEIL